MVAAVNGSVERMAKRQHQIELWRRRVVEQRESGLSVGDWCVANGCSKHSFYVWRAKLGLGANRRRVAGASVAQAENVVRRVRIEEELEGEQDRAADGVKGVADRSPGRFAEVFTEGSAGRSENRSIRICLGHGREVFWPLSLPMRELAELLGELERLTERVTEPCTERRP